MLEFQSDNHRRTYLAVTDLLPSVQSIDKRGVLLGNNRGIYALLKDGDSIKPYLVLRRSFLASCSSCWGWGLVHAPACPVTHYNVDDLLPQGGSEIFEEISSSDVRSAIEKAHHRIKLGKPLPTRKFGIVVIDIYGSYKDGWEITEETFKKIETFRKFTESFRLNQPGYMVVSQYDDHAILICSDDPNDDYVQFLGGALCELHEKVPICFGVTVDSLYYWNDRDIYSSGINRLWLRMREMPCGSCTADFYGLELLESMTQGSLKPFRRFRFGYGEK